MKAGPEIALLLLLLITGNTCIGVYVIEKEQNRIIAAIKHSQPPAATLIFYDGNGNVISNNAVKALVRAQFVYPDSSEYKLLQRYFRCQYILLDKA